MRNSHSKAFLWVGLDLLAGAFIVETIVGDAPTIGDLHNLAGWLTFSGVVCILILHRGLGGLVHLASAPPGV
jgi:hypothetical protein